MTKTTFVGKTARFGGFAGFGLGFAKTSLTLLDIGSGS
jgi:hypothetical protein